MENGKRPIHTTMNVYGKAMVPTTEKAQPTKRESPLNAMLSPKAASLDRTKLLPIRPFLCGDQLAPPRMWRQRKHTPCGRRGNLRYSPFSFRLGEERLHETIHSQFIVGLMAWVLVASLLNRVLRLALEGYAAAEPQMVFTHGMMAARLALGAQGCGAVERSRIVGARRSPARGIRPGTRSALGEISSVVSPCVSRNSHTACRIRRDVHSKPFTH